MNTTKLKFDFEYFLNVCFFQFGRFRKDSGSSSPNRNLATEVPSDIPEGVPEETKTSKFFKQVSFALLSI